MDFMIADTHFGDERILRYENRPFASVEDMDRQLILNWNQAVTETDRVFVLGDFSCYEEKKNRELLEMLKGKKILIMGNHDRHFGCEAWRDMGFAECVDWPVIYREFYILSHEPVYLNANMPYANFYGHVHNNPSYRDVSRQSFCVSVERIGYGPVTFGEICRRVKEEAGKNKG